MKQIQSLPIWDNGQTKEGNKFQCYSTFDNFQNSATLFYAIYADNKMLVSGNLTLGGADYEAWDSDPSANEWAYNWAAEQLNLTIIGDWVEPVVEPVAVEGTTPIVEESTEATTE